MQCDRRSERSEAFVELSLSLTRSRSVSAALRQFVAPELLSGTNSYRCTHCGDLADAHKQLLIERAPPVLVLLLKRYSHGRASGGAPGDASGVTKLTQSVSFEEELALGEFSSTGSSERYRLLAVIVHTGGSVNQGHYYCYVCAGSGVWYLLDDESVKQVSLQRVLHDQAYVIFYQRIEPKWVKKEPTRVSQSPCESPGGSPVGSPTPAAVTAASIPPLLTADAPKPARGVRLSGRGRRPLLLAVAWGFGLLPRRWHRSMLPGGVQGGKAARSGRRAPSRPIRIISKSSASRGTRDSSGMRSGAPLSKMATERKKSECRKKSELPREPTETPQAAVGEMARASAAAAVPVGATRAREAELINRGLFKEAIGTWENVAAPSVPASVGRATAQQNKRRYDYAEAEYDRGRQKKVKAPKTWEYT